MADAPVDHDFNIADVLLGVMYDGDFKCRVMTDRELFSAKSRSIPPHYTVAVTKSIQYGYTGLLYNAMLRTSFCCFFFLFLIRGHP